MRNYHYNHQFQKKIREEEGEGVMFHHDILNLAGLDRWDPFIKG